MPQKGRNQKSVSQIPDAFARSASKETYGLRRGTGPPNEADPMPRMVSRGAIRRGACSAGSRPAPSETDVAVRKRTSHIRSRRLGARRSSRRVGPLSQKAAGNETVRPKGAAGTLRVKIVRPAVLYRRWMNTKKRKKTMSKKSQGCSGQGCSGQGQSRSQGRKRKHGTARKDVGRRFHFSSLLVKNQLADL